MFDGTQLREHGAADEYAAPAINVPSSAWRRSSRAVLSSRRVDGRDPSLNAEVCGKTTLHAASCGFLASVGEYDAPKSLACAGLRAIALLEDPLAVSFVVVEGAVQGALDRQSPFLIQRGVRIR